MSQTRWIYTLVVLLLQAPLLMAQDRNQDGEPQADGGAEPAPAAVTRPSISLGIGGQALAQAYPDQARWLDTSADEQVLVMFEQEQTAQPRGAVLILADEGQSANTQLAGALRQPLIRAGWAAMAMGLPELPLPLAQARRLRESAVDGASDAPQGGEEPSNNEAERPGSSVMIDVMAEDNLESLAQRYEAQVQAGLAAGLAELRGQGYERLVLVAVGRAAELATRQALAGDQAVQSVVWIAPTLSGDNARSLAAQLEAAPLPVLDLTSSRRDDQRARERAAIMRRQGVTDYSQQSVAMASRPVTHNAGQLANRILAWLAR